MSSLTKAISDLIISHLQDFGRSLHQGANTFVTRTKNQFPLQHGEDIVDEAIKFFRANVFFKHFDIRSPADRILIYLTFHINVALKRLEGCRTVTEGTRAMRSLGLENVRVPGEAGFPFPGLFPLPRGKQEAEVFRDYLKQIREETSARLLKVAYRPNGTPNKWWLAFAKRKFINNIAF